MTDYTPEAILADVAEIRGQAILGGESALDRLLSLAERVARASTGTYDADTQEVTFDGLPPRCHKARVALVNLDQQR